MNNYLNNYAILKSKWVPNNPIETFLPFLVKVIMENKKDKFTSEELSKLFYDKWGFSINYSLLNNLTSYLYNSNMMIKNRKNSKKFDYEELKKINIKDIEVNNDNENLKLLLNKFNVYCGEQSSISLNEFILIITNFLKKYDSYIFSGKNINEIKYEDYDEQDEIYIFMFTEFAKKLFNDADPLFDYILQICQGSIIKNYILSQDKFDEKIWNNINVYIDTPVVLRLLGYSGKYMEDEYKYLIDSWNKLGANICIFEHTYDEIKELFDACEEWIESPYYDYSKASSLSNYFKMSRKKKEDVVEELVQIKSRLQSFSICIKDNKELESEKYWAQVASYKEVITKDYTKINELKKQFYTLDRNAEYDSKSLAFIKLLNSRKFYEITDLQNIFITSNSSLVEIFCNEYKNCISPVMKDTVIGLSVCVTNEKTYDKFMEMQLISYCNHIYKPNAETKEKYIQIIDSCKEKNLFDESRYLLLRNHYLVPEAIKKVTKGNCIELDEENIFDVLKIIEGDIVEEVCSHHNEEMDKVLFEFNQKEKNTEKKYQLEKIDVVLQSYNFKIRIIQAIKIALFIIALIGLIISFTNIFKDNIDNKAIKIIILIFVWTYNIVQLIEFIIAKFNSDTIKKIYNFFLKRKLKKLFKKHKVADNYILNPKGLTILTINDVIIK